MTTNSAYLDHRGRLEQFSDNQPELFIGLAQAERDSLNKYYRLSRDWNIAHLLAARANFLAKHQKQAKLAERVYRRTNTKYLRSRRDPTALPTPQQQTRVLVPSTERSVRVTAVNHRDNPIRKLVMRLLRLRRRKSNEKRA